MEARPWVVSVLSTSYDLKPYREAVITELKSKGITVSAFEEPEFPVEADKHSHDSCLTALQRADIAVLIINKRRGGRYYDSQNEEVYESITEKECSEVIKKGIPLFTFVKKEAWDERHSYKTKRHKFLKSKDLGDDAKEVQRYSKKFDEAYKCEYVDSVEILKFIEKMQHIYEEHQVSNWIDSFTDADDLVKKLVGRLKGFSRKIVERVAISQRNRLLNKHTSTAFGMTLEDVFNSEYYIEPPNMIESGTLSGDKESLSERICTTIRSGKSVLVYGEAGYGKTTILAKCFVNHLDSCLSGSFYEIPLYVSLKNKGANYEFDIETIINNEMESTDELLLKHEAYPYLDLDHILVSFYCDGFDEIAEEISIQDLERIRKSNVFSHPVLLTCRQQFANRYLKDAAFSDKFGVRVCINNWNIEIAKEYIEKFCSNKNIEQDRKNMIFDSIEKNSDLQQVLDSPLIITMFLWYIGKVRRPISSVTVAELFENWIEGLALRECEKDALVDTDTKTIMDVWAYSAWQIYLHKIKDKQYPLRIDDLINCLESDFYDNKVHINDSWFSTLFDCDDKYIIGTFHEQFMEYLVAKVLINACISRISPYPEFLKMVMRPEINRYFRGIWQQCSNDEKQSVFEALYEQYYDNIESDSEESVLVRVHAIYHIARLDYEKRAECIEKAFDAEKHISVLLSLYFGAIKIGMLDKEEEFYNHLIDDDIYNDANRGYHMVYYSDAIAGDTFPFKDDLSRGWEGTLKAFERHFSSEEIGHYYLRRIDLVTMIHLIEARKDIKPLNDELLSFFKESIDNCKYSSNSNYTEYNNKVKEAYDKLVEVYESYS